MTTTDESTGSKRTRLPAHERRAQILEEAAHVFSRDGFLSGSLATVAEGAGLSEPGLLHHYPSKNDLLLHLIADREQRNQATFERVLDETDDTIAALAAVLEENIEEPGLMQLFTIVSAEALTEDHPASEFFKRRYEKALSVMATHLEAEQANGTIRTDLDPLTIARLLVACADGLRYQYLIHDRPDGTMNLIETMRDLLKR